ncbi:RNA polymerase II mediator complex protein Nut2, putative [Talaromyces stipitatus ATCC 10500]|uniref:Mediator of RNA polymerase II transcription subunit 10 n=1 Tax=Talaromyces stipitatus (strain ATCC 10500 / CBS 375.48 / QM 6759 / NRRL 1006) TaxID=441959 RepID=B8M858_TALSN|nr:RNA polymerase II mediator complex protein Nut2, putative [Talaromyces stipitatus ATCC 10500]EED20020.1 RNA polymerase II mediator complex protein Nut2, putative [Talaromyces stipitatus ATCC 10500]
MAPVALSTVENELKDVIQHLFEIQSAVHGYLGSETQIELVRKIKNLTIALNTLSTDTKPDPSINPETFNNNNPINRDDPPVASIQLPPEIVDYVDAARNPDIYTREFVELVQRGNQDLKGKKEAFASFRDVLATEMRSAMPECRREVDRAIANTAGSSRGV